MLENQTKKQNIYYLEWNFCIQALLLIKKIRRGKTPPNEEYAPATATSMEQHRALYTCELLLMILYLYREWFSRETGQRLEEDDRRMN